MLDLNEIGVNDKKLFDEYIKPYKPQISEITFTNFFMWRNCYNFRYTVLEGFLCVVAEPDDKAPFVYMPIGPKEDRDGFLKAVWDLYGYFNRLGHRLKFERIYEEDLDVFKGIPNVELHMEFDKDNSDYLYLTSDMINLKGKKFDGKRNHINKFKKLYDYRYLEIDKSNIGNCYDIMEKWCAERDCKDHSGFYCEKVATYEALDNYDALDLSGALIEVDGKAKPFTVAEMLNDDTVVIHLEKADSKVQGLYTIINQQFCTNMWADTMYINREQDLGIEGLRKAKLSYNPVKMINKYSISINK